MDALNRAAPTATGRVTLPYWIGGFALIRTAAITFAVTAFATIAAVVTSYWKLQHARQDELVAQGLRDAARQSFVHVEAEKQDIRIYQPLFLDLRRRGFVGAESRLEWVEAIRQIQAARRLLPLTYQIEPQQPYKLAGRVATGEYQLRGSRMTVHMDLLHEMDLFDFLSDLRQRGVFTVQDCAMRRTASAGNAPLAPGLTADCTLNWLTLTPPAALRNPGLR
ncbi:hypothetical protein [Pseudoduganella chitinolytica]|uniref:Uncharacterized protein n=1 Tax=Pseudoduganella chitinolytica TaxID=34070 RepID=A0ABY8BFV7_9BURK|nr:hypothetical protein [Pseudoduganella chitinolytica]WEF34797.1 hypothetical protein PX653_08560 [Pseudoduganella chitinolytica]